MAFSNALLGIVHSMAHKTGAAFENGHIVHGCANAIYLPKVIKYNARNDEALSRYAKIARELSLEGLTDEQLTQALIGHIYTLNNKLNIPLCIKDYDDGIIGEEEFIRKIDTIAHNAINDACTLTNPREINVENMKKLLYCCYYNKEVDF